MSGSSRPSPSASLPGLIEDCRAIQRLLMRMLIASLCVALLLDCAFGCAPNRTVFVPEASPMRVGPSSSMRVWMRLDGVWTLSGNRIDVPEGWYLLPPSYVAEPEP